MLPKDVLDEVEKLVAEKVGQSWDAEKTSNEGKSKETSDETENQSTLVINAEFISKIPKTDLVVVPSNTSWDDVLLECWLEMRNNPQHGYGPNRVKVVSRDRFVDFQNKQNER